MKVRSIQKYLSGINKHLKAKIYQEYYSRNKNKRTVSNDKDRIHLANSIFEILNELETKSPLHKEVNVLFDAMEKVYKDLPQSLLDYVNV